MNEKMIEFPNGNMEWLEHDRFGMFIHWGLYSSAARHEWIQQLEETAPAEYRKQYFPRFEPDLFDPGLWADAAADAGMKYFCMTAKHHDGFCLWDTQESDYKITNTPYGKDVLQPIINAFNARGLRTGLYYSLLDWHHPEFVIDSVHPLRFHPKRKEWNSQRDQQKYIDYMHRQVRELLTGFGDIDLMFFDFSYKSKFAWPENMEDEWQGKGREDWGSIELMKLIRQLQPQMLVNDRLDLDDMEGGWDFRTPEQFEPREWVEFNGRRVPWVTSGTFSGSWGYFRDESSWKSVDQLIRMLINAVGNGGSLLLNVGPTGRGEFDSRALDRLKGIGKWMRQHSRSIHGCTAAPDELPRPQDGRYTYNPKTNRLYVHVYAWPTMHLHLDGLKGRVEYAQFLHDGSEVQLGMGEWYENQQSGVGDGNSLTLTLPIIKPDVSVPVIELFLKD